MQYDRSIFTYLCAEYAYNICILRTRRHHHQDGVASNACVSRHRVVRFALAVVMMMMMMMMISDDDDAGTGARVCHQARCHSSFAAGVLAVC